MTTTTQAPYKLNQIVFSIYLGIGKITDISGKHIRVDTADGRCMYHTADELSPVTTGATVTVMDDDATRHTGRIVSAKSTLIVAEFANGRLQFDPRYVIGVTSARAAAFLIRLQAA